MRRSQHRRWTTSATCLKSERTLLKWVIRVGFSASLRCPVGCVSRTHVGHGGRSPLCHFRKWADDRHDLCKLSEQCLRLLQIACLKTFSEPAVNRSKQFARLLRFAQRRARARVAPATAGAQQRQTRRAVVAAKSDVAQNYAQQVT